VVRWNFALISANFLEKFLRAFCPQIFSHKEREDLFLVCPPKQVQARKQLRTPGGVKNFLRGVQFFLTMSNSLKLCLTHLSRGAKNFLGGFCSPCAPHGYGPE